MRIRASMLQGVGAAIAVSVVTACGGSGIPDYQPQQTPHSELTAEQRREIREIMHPFLGTGPNSVQVLSLIRLLKDEGKLRAAVDGALYNIRQDELDLTESFPENDPAGNFAGHGWDSFTETYNVVVTDPNDSSLSVEAAPEKETHKQRQKFESGSVTQTIAVTHESNVMNEVEIGNLHDFSLTSDVSYVETVNLAPQKTFVTKTVTNANNNNVPLTSHDEKYEYQSYPKFKATMNSGSNCNIQTLTKDTILSQQGWDSVDSSKTYCDAEGTYTIYKPVLVEENVASAGINDPDPVTTGDETTDSITVTSVNGCTDTAQADCGKPTEAAVTAGPDADGELTEFTVVTITTHEESVVDAGFASCPGLPAGPLPNLKSYSKITHTSTKKTYAQTDAPGMNELVRQYRSFEKFFDHVDTIRETETITATCNKSTGEYTWSRVVLTEKSTTDPNRINNVASFLSSEHRREEQMVVTDADNNYSTTTTTDYGTKYLTDKIVEDRTYVWKISGGSDTATTNTFRLLGNDAKAWETTGEQITTFNSITYEVDGKSVTFDGTFGTREASQVIDPNTPGGEKNLATGHYGSLNVIAPDGTSVTMAGVEYLGDLYPHPH